MICLLGVGEVGQTFAQDLSPGAFAAWDLQFTDPASGPAQAMTRFGLALPEDAHAAIREADVIVSAVTAAQDEKAAHSVAGGLRPGAWFIDVNSASPTPKRAAAEIIETAQGRYVEAVIMSPIGAKRIASPMLLGGQHAQAFLPLAHALGFAGATVFSHQIGPASVAKLCRSVIIKGLEALLTESILAARHYGVERAVIDSLADFFPGQDWEKLAQYMITRGLRHGARRAEEMREAAETVAETGLDPLMCQATAALQDWCAKYKDALSVEDLPATLDCILRDARRATEEEDEC